MTAQALLRGAERVFWIAGVVLCGVYTGSYLESRYTQAVENRRLEEALRAGGTPRPPAVSRRPERRAAGTLVGRLEIPRLNLSAIVLEGSDSSTLRAGVGRISETANPGQRGNVVLSGHRDTFFRPLRGVRAGDRIALVTPRGSFCYRVEWTEVVDPTDISSLRPTPAPSLTLVTCYPFYYVGPGAPALHRAGTPSGVRHNRGR